MPRLPIGQSDFPRLREPGVLYVDKTNFVTQVLSASAAVMLIPRPRRFGKTVNLSTVRYFVEKSNVDRSGLFEGLSVWGSVEARPHFQRYPVIWLTLKDVKARTFDEAFAAIRREIGQMYKEHVYLYREGALGEDEAARFKQILAAEGSEALYAYALRELTALLARYHGERVFVLVDEYDAPIHSISPGEDERRLLDFFRVFLSGGLKDNVHLFRGVLTGILRIAQESLFSGLNNLAVYSLLAEECATSFGFTEAEVRDLAAKMGAEASLGELERWYNGYRFGGEVIYNPWSILNFLTSKDKVLRPYWVHTSSDDLLRRALLMHGVGNSGELETLLSGGEIEKVVNERVALRELELNSESVWSFLLFTGYLRANTVRVDDQGNTLATLAVPNKEVHYAYRTLFRSWMEQQIGSSQVEELLRAVISGGAAVCERLLCQLLESLSIHDLATRRISRGSAKVARTVHSEPTSVDEDIVFTPEQVYHVFVVSLLLGLQPRYLVRSNRESGSGRYDVMILPRTAGQPGVVLELKVRSAKRETAARAMTAALRQIRDGNYAADLRAMGADPIHELGVVFDGKRAFVKAATASKVRVRRKAPPRRKAGAKR
ncbi:MAG: AAA family ATPase [Polyangiaceae bacterium]|nr:AAA family ATPase [Polyangiaceae bacterium]